MKDKEAAIIKAMSTRQKASDFVDALREGGVDDYEAIEELLDWLESYVYDNELNPPTPQVVKGQLCFFKLPQR